MAKSLTLPQVDFQKIADEFRYLNPNDPGAWPLIPKVVILAGWFFAVLIAGWWFVWSDQLTELALLHKSV